MDLETIKREIKEWEHLFRKKTGKAPTKDDVKANPNIAFRYKQYNSQRKPPQTPTKRKRHVLHTPQKTSPHEVIPDSPFIVTTEIGPTPQLNGKVLSIFDVITSPQITPTKQNRPQIIDEVHNTPKKKLDFNSLMETGDKKLPEFKTPVKTKAPVIEETPAYLRMGVSQNYISASPSPLASQRIRKGLSTIIHELQDIQDELRYGDFDEDELLPQISDASEDEPQVENSELLAAYKKKKTQKRQTRSVKLKSRPVTERDEVGTKNLRSELERLTNENQERNNAVKENDSSSEEWSEDEYHPYVPKPMDPNTKYKPAVSRNFKKLKINKKKSFFGKRSRGR